jgi:hypothetical protein
MTEVPSPGRPLAEDLELGVTQNVTLCTMALVRKLLARHGLGAHNRG